MASLAFRTTLVGFLLCSWVAAPYAVAAVMTCDRVVSAVTPCIDYLRNGGEPSSLCCTGLQSLNSAATTTSDRQTVCSCVKRAAAAVTGLVYQQVVSLPAKCGLHVPYQITPTTDCSKVQ
ncbi:non-specific lipid-transfer protein 1-like isoform X2 [Aristolochia californica]|uniref:non-specific lipid-transfer protein 1-like isoform X1 n=1 Tax=Aristolochia californica TaxID=171875 RepID=UPI0035E1D652